MASISMATDGFRTFCEQTTLHGWQYIGNAESNNKIKLYFWSANVIKLFLFVIYEFS